MIEFEIEIPNRKIYAALMQKINNKTKPNGSLGKLEQLALQISLIQQSLEPQLKKPHLIVFAGSHGIADEGVSAYPKEVTHQMVLNFMGGGAAINVFTKQHNINLILADAGVDKDFEAADGLLNVKINYGTKSFLTSDAMSEDECSTCFDKAQIIVQDIKKQNCNVVAFGEMGIGNTSSAALIMSKILNIPLSKCIGRGSGINDLQFEHKKKILEESLKFHKKQSSDPIAVLQSFGGFEIAMICAAMLAAAQEKMIVLVDGFIASVAFLCAYCINPEVKHYSIFTHLSQENGHKILLKNLEVEPLLNLEMRLGEGTGCAIAYPILKSAVLFLNEMASFEQAGVSGKIED